MIKLISLILLCSSCTLLHKKYNYGMLRHNELEEGYLELKTKQLKKEKCLKLAFIVPFGDFHVDDIETTVNELLDKNKGEVALANVTHEIEVKGFPLIYIQRCVTLTGNPLIYKN